MQPEGGAGETATTTTNMVVVGILERSQIYFEMALLIALLGFVGTVAVARFVTRGNIIG